MSTKASPWENGYQESFYNNFKTLGLEFDRFQDTDNPEAIHQQIFYYNKQNPHLPKDATQPLGNATNLETFCLKKGVLDNTPIEEMHNPKILHYVFYHCTKRVHLNCTQGSATLDKLETKIKNTLNRFEIAFEYKDWAIEYLNELNDIEEVDQKSVKDNLQARVGDVDQQLRGLLRLYTA